MLCFTYGLRPIGERRWMAFPPPHSSSSTPPPTPSTCHLHPFLPLSPSVSHPFFFFFHPPPPLLPLPSSGLLLSRHLVDTPAETSDLISGQEVRGVQVPRVRIIPHISARSILEKGECAKGATGVWSPHAREFLTTRPCHVNTGA